MDKSFTTMSIANTDAVFKDEIPKCECGAVIKPGQYFLFVDIVVQLTHLFVFVRYCVFW